MALFKSNSPTIRFAKHMESAYLNSPDTKMGKITDSKKTFVSPPCPGKGLYNPKTPTAKLSSPNLISANNSVSNNSFQNYQQVSHFKKPIQDSLGSPKDIKLNQLKQKKQKKMDCQSLFLNTSNSRDDMNQSSKGAYNSISNLLSPTKLSSQNPVTKHKRPSNNPEQANNQSLNFNNYGLYSPPQKPNIGDLKNILAKTTVENKLRNILHQNSDTAFQKIAPKEDIYELKLEIQKSKEKVDDNYQKSVKVNRSSSKGKLNASKHNVKLLRQPTKELKVAPGKIKTTVSPRESEKKARHSRLQERRQAKEFSGLITEFEIGKCLGNGKFGNVHMARHKKTGFIVAIKSIPKKIIRQYNLQNQIQTEIRHQFNCNHPSIVQLYGFFGDESALYLVMEYMPDGTLFSHLHRHKKLQQEEVAYILLEICNAICYLHNHKIAHRDIKPENIVMSFVKRSLTKGFSKICDFGWSAKTMNPRKTYCGTLDYAPPQILQHKQYSQTVDLWCIGVLAYELLTGKVPFHCEDRSQMTKKVINVENERFQFPQDISLLARDLIDRLVRKKPQERLKASEILEHEFIKSYTLNS